MADSKQARETARLQKLEGLAQSETRLWSRASGLVEEKNTKACGKAVSIFKDFQELATHRDQISSFTLRVRHLRQQYPGL